MHKKFWLFTSCFLIGLYACEKATIDAFEGFRQPAHFPAPAYRFEQNPVTKERFELGRKLFYENMLSADNSINCGSCHIQTAAFTHHGHTVSHGIMDRLGTRNAPPIMNLAWSTSFMWDGGIADLDLQSIAPITNHVEMDESMPNVIAKLQASATYKTLFKKAYGTEEISTTRFLKALSQFMLLCTSSNSKYDSVMRKEPGVAFSPAEQAGYSLVRQKCGGCHQEPLFTDQSFRNNGLRPAMINDEGRFAITQQDSDRYKFKVPSLRNLAYTAPYMHDGRLLTLEAVLDHYTNGVQNTPNLDPLLQQHAQPGVPLTSTEKNNILQFLQCLNDRQFLFNPNLSEQ